MTTANGHARRFRDPILARQLAEATRNLGAPNRALWFQGGGGADPDPRRSLEDEYGWPTAPDPSLYDKLYNWDTIAARIVSLPPWQCWRVDPAVYELESKSRSTGFERSFDEMCASLWGEDNYYRPEPEQGGNQYFEAMRRLDILHRKGRFGVMWYGFDDGEDPREPIPGFTENFSFPVVFERGEKKLRWLGEQPDEKRNQANTFTWNRASKRKLQFLRPFSESQVQVTRWEGNRNSPRYLQPLEYLITEIDPSSGYSGLGLPTSQVTVHWTRTTHHADTYHHAVGGGGALATPALQVPLYDVLDARKVSGASPEAFYRTAVARLFFETLPQFGADAIVDEDSIRDMMEEIDNGMQKHGVLKGLHANQLPSTVMDPTPHVDGKLKRIAIYLAKPKRILEGSERGELSSGQDERQDSEDISGRQNRYCSACLLAPSINRLIQTGVLEAPAKENGFKIEWPPVHNANEIEAAQVFASRMQGFSAAIAGGVPDFIGDKNFLVAEAGYSDEEAEQYLADREKQALADEQDSIDRAKAIGAEPAPPPGFSRPQPPQPVKLKPGEKLVSAADA